jgi:hypothetical protein
MKKKVYEMAKFNKCIAQIGALLVFLGAEAWSSRAVIYFSSPELKAQVSYSDRPSSVNFYIFGFFSWTTGPILTRLCTNHPLREGILNS